MFDEFYSRHYPLSSIGKENQYKLKYRKVLIAGMGGLGSVSSQLLNSIGIGNLVIIDFDIVETSNLARQTLYTQQDVGRSKVEVAKERLEMRNPFVTIEEQMIKIDALNVNSLLGGIDLIIDALDRFSARRILFRAAYDKKIPYVFAGAVAESGNVMSFTHDKEEPCLECVIGESIDDENQRCEVLGVNPVILHLTAGIQVNEAVKILLDQKPDLVGKLQLIDLFHLDFDKIPIRKKEGCTLCNSSIDKKNQQETTKDSIRIEGLGEMTITSLCGRDTYICEPRWNVTWNFISVMKKIEAKYSVRQKGKNYINFIYKKSNVNIVENGLCTIRHAGTSQQASNIVNELYAEFML
ncbi:MAG: HesA/MoeB/ThiF family protein [Candidatus Heimdallarchaeota archaeon]|nr:HesA/MoeB/ThiF family protein [Candidatus Heimdallarchaeota archaeon]